MPNSPLDSPASDDAVAVIRRLRAAGRTAYLAGGCVRDLLLGRAPKDFDVATDAPPGQVRELFNNTQAVGAAFGVILVRLRGSQIEVATFRSDGAYQDGRRPADVRFTTAEEDARRRDFTINGLYLDPLAPGAIEDRVIDFVGGRADLSARLVRAIGDPRRRFAEDHLRLLRAVRFAARLSFTIEPATFDAIRDCRGELAGVSPERIGEELRLMLTPPTRRSAWPLLWSTGLIHAVLRALPPAPVQIDPRQSALLALNPDQTISWGLALAAATLCYRWQAAGPDADPMPLLTPAEVRKSGQTVRSALRISNETLELMQAVLIGAGDLLRGLATLASRKRFLARPSARESRDLAAAIVATPGRDWPDFAPLQAALTELESGDFAPPPLLDGDALTAAGLSPGPAFKRLLDRAYDEQLEGHLQTREQALTLALRWASHDA